MVRRNKYQPIDVNLRDIGVEDGVVMHMLRSNGRYSSKCRLEIWRRLYFNTGSKGVTRGWQRVFVVD